MLGWQKAFFGSRDVKADDPIVPVPNCKLRDLKSPVRVTHRNNDLPSANEPALVTDFLHAPLKAVLHCFNRFIEAQPHVQVLFGRPAQFRVNYIFFRQVNDSFIGDPLQPGSSLHNTHGVLKS